MEDLDLTSSGTSVLLSESLHNVLTDLHENSYPHVPNPPQCKKRASVALVLRVRPTFNHQPDPSSPPARDVSAPVKQQLNSFFSQSWVQNGEPEALFIKRSSRVGDRWTGHVALPGGKRDPEDIDDKAAAIREAAEEVGLDLTDANCIYVGNLPERVVTTSWGSIPLMVLCPYVFLLTGSDSPTLALQPAEVASTHWVSLRVLLSPSQRTVENVDMTQRLTSTGGFLARLVARCSPMGFMQFSAIQLIPTETLRCSTNLKQDIERSQTTIPDKQWKSWFKNTPTALSSNGPPLLLWGLTLGILADFLDMLPPHTAVQLWNYPNFTSPDLRLIINLLTYSLRKRNLRQVKFGARPNDTAVDGEAAALPVVKIGSGKDDHNQVGIGGLGVGRYYGSSEKSPDGSAYAVGVMLRGYYDKVRVALYIFFAWRIAMGSATAAYAWRLFRRRR